MVSRNSILLYSLTAGRVLEPENKDSLGEIYASPVEFTVSTSMNRECRLFVLNCLKLPHVVVCIDIVSYRDRL